MLLNTVFRHTYNLYYDIAKDLNIEDKHKNCIENAFNILNSTMKTIIADKGLLNGK